MSKTVREKKETLTPNQIKLFKNSSFVEGFYRYIHEHDLRSETCSILKYLLGQRRAYSQKASGRRRGKVLQ